MDFQRMSKKMMLEDLSVATRRVTTENLTNQTLLRCKKTPNSKLIEVPINFSVRNLAENLLISVSCTHFPFLKKA